MSKATDNWVDTLIPFFQQWKKEQITEPISIKIITLFITKTKIPVQS